MLNANISMSDVDLLIDSTKKNIVRNVKLGVEETTRNASTIAKQNTKVRSGALTNSIKISKDYSTNKFVGKVFVSLDLLPYAKFVHFGTGRHSLMSDSKRLDYWYTKTSNFPDYENYGLTPIKAQDGNMIVKVTPQVATPFMYIAYDSVKDSFRSNIIRYMNANK